MEAVLIVQIGHIGKQELDAGLHKRHEWLQIDLVPANQVDEDKDIGGRDDPVWIEESKSSEQIACKDSMPKLYHPLQTTLTQVWSSLIILFLAFALKACKCIFTRTLSM